MSEDFRTRARLVPKGNRYEDFEVGRVFRHHWGRTITESESTLFSTLTLHFNPHYFNAEYARLQLDASLKALARAMRKVKK